VREATVKDETIDKHMTPLPRTIDRHASLSAAHELMRSQGIRHLPVLDGRRLVGLVSLDDLHLVETLGDIDLGQVEVEDAMSPRPLRFGPEATLFSVVEAMEKKKVSSAVVTKRGSVLGVFTTIDALRALRTILDRARRPRARVRSEAAPLSRAAPRHGAGNGRPRGVRERR
jgi:acetoin utilization protein AcuB